VTVWLEPDDKISVSPVSLPFMRAGTNMARATRYDTYQSYGVAFQWLEMEGPLTSQWPPESHRRLFGDLPLTTTSSDLQPRLLVQSANLEADARRLLAAFAQRAYRRPIKVADLDFPLERITTKLREGASFLDAMLAGYALYSALPIFCCCMRMWGLWSHLR
jgi:hypothetical protein